MTLLPCPLSSLSVVTSKRTARRGFYLWFDLLSLLLLGFWNVIAEIDGKGILHKVLKATVALDGKEQIIMPQGLLQCLEVHVIQYDS
ncbi:hypothetical protein NC652_014916 [Populus alba x Populus x berolinensis]|uniref:Uncharacterized protein n=1 Tax=Populus alba x Populus x berolinensis TaxID=444605 RepID=A0AAD6W4F5_9ROSI|nr:hypothetical protein NC652_014916 [Populus alba x Populus x berolinensis]KAJ6998837.1 hypothetical protein NC653_014863 [Populus alba x Populus x berolinensis]